MRLVLAALVLCTTIIFTDPTTGDVQVCVRCCTAGVCNLVCP